MRAELPLASGSRRVLAVFLDFWGFFLIWISIAILQPVNSLLYSMAFYLTLDTALTAFLGTTPGRLIAGIRLVRAKDGRRPGVRTALLRTGLILATGWLGLFAYVIRLVGAGPVHRMWWDTLAGTQLVQVRGVNARMLAFADPGLGTRSTTSDRFRDLVNLLTLKDLEQVYGTSGLGYQQMTRRTRRYPTSRATEADEVIAKKLGFRRYLRGGAVNFETVMADKLGTAMETVAAAPTLPDEDFVAGTSPFMPVMPVGWPSDRPRVAALRQPAARAQMLASYRGVLEQHAASEVVSKSALPAPKSDLRTALCLESIGADEKLANQLADEYVSLCNFVANPGAAQVHAEVASCQRNALIWLGHEVAKDSILASLGSRPASVLSETADSSDWITTFAYFYGMFGVFVALGQCQAKKSYGAGLLALGGTYVPLALMFGLDWLQKRGGVRPVRTWVRWILVWLAIVVTPLAWAASCWVVPASSEG
ncbi:MAG TPA: RDD family protein [Candidatus Nitrosotalea sp.]|nr:RDD family protein [Candidatus Nitrosotalea sp.]